LEVLAPRVSLESTGEAGKLMARGAFEVVAFTVNEPPVSAKEVRLIEAFKGLLLVRTMSVGWDPSLSLSRPTSTPTGLFEVSIIRHFVVLNTPLMGLWVVRIEPDVADKDRTSIGDLVPRRER